MKVFFGESLDDMIRELRARGVDTVRIHALPETKADSVTIKVHSTTLCGGQIYESVITTRTSLQDVDPKDEKDFIGQACEEERDKVKEEFGNFEVRRGIIQE